MDGVSKIREEELTPLVEEFYARVRADPALGPIFNDAIDDWPEHLGKLTAFWSSVMLTSGRCLPDLPIPYARHPIGRLRGDLLPRVA